MGDTTMTEYTETEVQVRVTRNACDCEYTTKHCDEYHQRGTLMPLPMLEDPVAWFAAHDAEVAANALREVADSLYADEGHSIGHIVQALKDVMSVRADRIERDAADRKSNHRLGNSEGADRG